MKALEVFINGHRVCLAGVGDDGVLNAIVNWVGGPDRDQDFFLQVGGLDSRADEHLRWEAAVHRRRGRSSRPSRRGRDGRSAE